MWLLETIIETHGGHGHGHSHSEIVEEAKEDSHTKLEIDEVPVKKSVFFGTL